MRSGQDDLKMEKFLINIPRAVRDRIIILGIGHRFWHIEETSNVFGRFSVKASGTCTYLVI